MAAGALAQLSLPPGHRAAPPPSGSAVEALLAERSRALLSGNAGALNAVTAPGARPAQRDCLQRLAKLPFAELSYRLHGAPGAGPAEAELAYRVRGFDDHPAMLSRRLRFAGGLLAADEPAGTPALWDLGEVVPLRGAHCLVLALVPRVADYAAAADRAVPAVQTVWGSGWAGQLLLQVPADETQFARLLDASPDAYQGEAAVTSSVPGAPVGTPADRITVNPEAWSAMSALGRQVVLTHEATHVATRADTRSWTPLWLSEGVADYTGYRGTGLTGRQIAPELAADVAAGRLPAGLPSDADFAPGGSGIAQAYEGAWLACQLIAREFGEQRLVALYRAVGSTDPGGQREGWLDGPMRAELGLDTAEFTRQWLSEVRRSLS